VKSKRFFPVLTIALAVFATLAFSPGAFAQNCALCYTQAASAGHRMIEALRSGILVLIIPPTLMWLVIAAIAHAKRNQFKHAGQASGSGSDW
jgi:hypothetical protein